MSGQIPKYGENFRLESTPWTPHLANRVYVLKRDPAWFIRSDKTSEIWRVYHWHLDHAREMATPIGTPLSTFGEAMTRLLAGIEQGFYQISPIETAPMKASELSRFLCVLECQHTGRRGTTIDTDGVWVKQGSGGPVSSAHQDCFTAWNARNHRTAG